MRKEFLLKRTILFIVLFFCYDLCVFAQNENKMAIGLGPEWNMNSRHNFAGGVALDFNYNLPYLFATGLSVAASYNFKGITVLEGVALLRRYFSLNDHTGFFAQIDLGTFILFEGGETTPMFLGGLRGGFCLPLGKFFIEPYGRLGYPFAFGVGVLAGIRF